MVEPQVGTIAVLAAAEEDPVALAGTLREHVISHHRSLLHSGVTVPGYFAMHVLGATFPVTAAFMLYGWRALLLIGMVLGGAAAAVLVWKRIGVRGRRLTFPEALWYALLLSLTLPAHLAGWDTGGAWAIAPASGIALVIVLWLVAGLGSGRVHPVLVTQLLLVVLFFPALVPHRVLQRNHLFLGDVMNAEAEQADAREAAAAWVTVPLVARDDAVWEEPASQRLTFFTTGTESPDRSWQSLEELLRDRMPPLEDLILGGHPGPIGAGSAIAVIMGGLFLLYRGVIDYRIPLIIVGVAFLTFLVLPVPVVITEAAPQWRWLAGRDAGVGWAAAVTFVNYEIMAGPLLFTAFFLATAPAVRPVTRRGRTIFAVLIGLLAAAGQLYAAVAFAPYLAVFAVSLLTPVLDRMFGPRPLV